MNAPGFIVRVARPTDADSVTCLLEASYPVLMVPAYDEDLLKPALQLMTKAQPGLLASGTYFVAVSADGSIIGCGGWTKEQPGDGAIRPGVGHIRHFGTDPAWTRRGVGRALYERCATGARKAGVHELECYSSLNAEGFYSALGFELIGYLDIPMKDDVVLPAAHMKCRL